MTRRYILRLWQARHAFDPALQDITREAFQSPHGIEPLFCFAVGGEQRVTAKLRDEPPWEGNGYRARRCAMVEVTA